MIHDNTQYEVKMNGKISIIKGLFLKAMMRDGHYPDSYKEVNGV